MSPAIIPPQQVDLPRLRSELLARYNALRPETLSVTKGMNAEYWALTALEDCLMGAIHAATLIESVRFATGVTDHDIRARLALSYIEAVLGA